MKRSRRRGPAPWIVLGAVALVPASMLLGVYIWSSGQDTASTEAPPAEPSTSVAEPSPALPTGVMAFRRVPTIMSRNVNSAAFEAEVAPLLASLNDRSCSVVSVDGHTSPTSLDALADRVVAAGVSRVSGGVVGDGTRYDDEFYAPGWGAGVPGLEGGPYDALMANDSRVFGEELRAADPNSAAAREFIQLLRARGVVVDGGDSSGAAPIDAVEIASVDSASLSAVIGEMLANSDNNSAELVVKELGASESVPGTREAGLAAIASQLTEWGVNVGPLVLADGSGLSPDNRVTCAALASVVQRFDSASPIGSGLPIAGQTGTLSDVFVDHAVSGRMTGKTGTLNNPPFNTDPPAVKALSGYLPVDGGGEVEYVLILNGPTISDQSEYRPIWNQLADVLDTYPTGPSPADLGPR